MLYYSYFVDSKMDETTLAFRKKMVPIKERNYMWHDGALI